MLYPLNMLGKNRQQLLPSCPTSKCPVELGQPPVGDRGRKQILQEAAISFHFLVSFRLRGTSHFCNRGIQRMSLPLETNEPRGIAEGNSGGISRQYGKRFCWDPCYFVKQGNEVDHRHNHSQLPSPHQRRPEGSLVYSGAQGNEKDRGESYSYAGGKGGMSSIGHLIRLMLGPMKKGW